MGSGSAHVETQMPTPTPTEPTSGSSVGERQTVLLVEHKDPDRQLLLHAVDAGGFSLDLRCARDGEEALAYLQAGRAGAEPSANPRPRLILLELDVPRMDGLTFLEEIKRDSLLSSIPVVMLTASSRRTDIQASIERGAAAFIEKTADPDDLDDLLVMLMDFVMGQGELPDQPLLGRRTH